MLVDVRMVAAFLFVAALVWRLVESMRGSAGALTPMPPYRGIGSTYRPDGPAERPEIPKGGIGGTAKMSTAEMIHELRGVRKEAFKTGDRGSIMLSSLLMIELETRLEAEKEKKSK